MPGPDDFQKLSDNFLSWLTRSPGATVSPKICIADLRNQGAGRGVGELSLSVQSYIDIQAISCLLTGARSCSTGYW